LKRKPFILTQFGKKGEMLMLNRIKAVMLGHAIGDALGVPVEFNSRERLEKSPVVDMRGFGTYNVPAGTWSDDTSMSLCALASMSKGNIDYDDIMRNFGKWCYDGEFTTDGVVFDIGNTCSCAIDNYFYGNKPVSRCGMANINSNGNGSLMRIHPFVLYAYYNNMNENEFVEMIDTASSLTHAHVCSVDGCVIYAYILRELLNVPIKSSVYKGIDYARSKVRSADRYYNRVFSGELETLDREDIKSTGYVVSSLEAAIWCLLTTDSYAECVLKAVNLGGDTDTIAAIAGSLAGALYGLDAIPANWVDKLRKKEYIEEMCNEVCEAWK
jgi:ADP-ribosylglycohydrolase